ncbi:5-keto-4-deoxy-D-glucarate aldolase [Pigmentiphaga humi]|uniref:5-keto-4-deoxy-D-glucarate aldolase n=1 Tax=Pigmentiphaga humi TaxID=2478468 RepID=A0A3P4B796_9BURK|nr:aldolase/citrate lyase family protein [Pigmentiphaga humi]VCU71811.1 5-keto-4-deoxy-D-glucarate aldolase [Pigmentiphaga humi]
MTAINKVFRDRLRARAQLGGTFIKTPAYQHVEIAGGAGLDFVVLDAEHAVFDPAQLDQCVLAACAAGTAAVVRLPDPGASSVLRVLDMGAAGVLVPHVTDADCAREIIARTRYAGGVRGYSNSPRSGGYGALSMARHMQEADSGVSVLCQIEDKAGVDNIEAIAAVPGVDCLFIGRADLAVSYGVAELDHPLVAQAVDKVVRAGAAAGVAVGIFLPDAGALDAYAARGVSLFVIGSDQSWLRAAALGLSGRMASART